MNTAIAIDLDETADMEIAPEEVALLRVIYSASEFASKRIARATCRQRVVVCVHYTSSIYSGETECTVYLTQVNTLGLFFALRVQNQMPECNDFVVTAVAVVGDAKPDD